MPEFMWAVEEIDYEGVEVYMLFTDEALARRHAEAGLAEVNRRRAERGEKARVPEWHHMPGYRGVDCWMLNGVWAVTKYEVDPPTAKVSPSGFRAE